MANIHFIGGEKGGVGKSVVARVLAQYFIDHNHPFLGFDTDRSHGALMRFYVMVGGVIQNWVTVRCGAARRRSGRRSTAAPPRWG